MEGYSSDSSDGEVSTSLDLSHLSLFTPALQLRLEQVINTAPNLETLLLFSNSLLSLPPTIVHFQCLRVLDISSNALTYLPSILTQCSLTTLIAKNNNLECDSFPKSFGLLQFSLKELNLSGNNLLTIPEQILDIRNLRYLHLGSNRIVDIPKDIKKLSR
jgi:Leucine-rich repeat (LRR) protein